MVIYPSKLNVFPSVFLSCHTRVLNWAIWGNIPPVEPYSGFSSIRPALLGYMGKYTPSKAGDPLLGY